MNERPETESQETPHPDATPPQGVASSVSVPEVPSPARALPEPSALVALPLERPERLALPPAKHRWWQRFIPGWEGGTFLLLMAIALGMRLWELGGRAIHYDEAIHANYAYLLATRWQYTHSPWCHGPFLYHANAFVYSLFGASDFTARLVPALFGAALVGLPYLFRRYIGIFGAIAMALLLAFSPSMLYFSRFIRQDIYIAFWMLAIFIFAWRYFHERKNRYLYLTAAALALAFAANETAFIMVGLFGIVFGLMALPQVISWARYRTRFRDLAGPAGILILMATLVLPQFTPLVGLFQDSLGIILVNNKEAMGPVGQPVGVLATGISLGIIVFTITVLGIIGILWRGRVWITCAFIYYAIWLTLFTTVYKHPLGGFHSGMWESMGYWLAQQEVARGGQPWYFFLVMAVNYELLPFLLAIPALVYYGMKRDKLGVMLGLLSLCTFGVYTWTSEKMPWLTVEVVLPFIVLAGKFIGDITGGLVSGILPRFHAAWMLLRVAGMADARRRASWALVADSLSLLPLVAIPAAIALGVWLLSRYVHSGELDTTSLMLMVSVALLILLTLTVMLFDRWQGSVKLGALGMSVLLVGFYAFVGLRASYTYDDTPVEMLVYAQGSYQMREVAREVQKEMEKHADDEVAVDYELWYPYAWYARDDKYVHYYCYKEQNEDGWVSWCKPIKEVPKAAIVLLNTQHGRRDAAQLVANYERRGEYRNLLWFPQVYRIPEIQTDDGFLKRRGKELQYVWDNVQRRLAWDGFLDYVIYRRLNSPWWFSDFYAYFPKAG